MTAADRADMERLDLISTSIDELKIAADRLLRMRLDIGYPRPDMECAALTAARTAMRRAAIIMIWAASEYLAGEYRDGAR